MRKTLHWSLILVGSMATAIALATILRVARAPQGPALGFENGGLSLPFALRSGEEYDFPVEVVNVSGAPARLIGALEYCSGECYSVRGLPVSIPPNGQGRVIVHIEARVEGDFEDEVTFYTDQPSQPTLLLTVRGHVEETDHDGALLATEP